MASEFSLRLEFKTETVLLGCVLAHGVLAKRLF